MITPGLMLESALCSALQTVLIVPVLMNVRRANQDIRKQDQMVSALLLLRQIYRTVLNITLQQPVQNAKTVIMSLRENAVSVLPIVLLAQLMLYALPVPLDGI